MHQQINEKIHVLVSFIDNKVQPLVFRWGGKIYKIKKVHLVHVNKLGKSNLYHFSVTDDSTYYKLTYHSDEMHWTLSEIYTQ